MAIQRLVLAVAVAVAVLPSLVRAADVDPKGLYQLSTEGSTTHLKSGAPGTFVLSIVTPKGAHISEEAPLKLELVGKNVTLTKTLLTRSDAHPAPAVEKKDVADPRFEVPFVATSSGSGTVEGKLTFFVCTAQLCSRQQQQVSLPVEVK